MTRREDDRSVAPPVEGLSDIAWQRVEKNLFAALDCDASVPVPVSGKGPAAGVTLTWNPSEHAHEPALPAVSRPRTHAT